jgi:transposase
MATERLEMHVLREILRQKLTLRRSHRQVVKALGVSIGKISGALARATAIGLDAQGIERLTDAELEAALYPKAVAASARAVPDCAALHLELRRPKVTLALLHVEFIEGHADGIGYSAFCDRYREWSKRTSPVMRQTHVAGDKLFVDYAGMKAKIVDRSTGEVTEVELFVAVLGASNYTFAEATRTQQVPDFAGSVARALTFIGGVPNAIVPDQLKSAVTGACRYEPAIQRTTAELGRHYGTTILPARPKSPRDKAKVEAGVLVAERWLLARIRNETFTSLGALNARLSELTADLNGRTMKTYKASRRDLFERLDKPALGPLPASPFEASTWKEVRLNIDYHFELDHHLYSAPYQLVREELWVRATANTVEVFHRGNRIDSHLRSYIHGARTTRPEHMPSTHRAQAEWTPSRILGWAEQEVGPGARALCETILRERRHPEWGFRSCLGLLRLAKKYGNARVENASSRALHAGARSYRHVKTILQHNLDGAPLPEPEQPAVAGAMHENVRGRDYYH